MTCYHLISFKPQSEKFNTTIKQCFWILIKQFKPNLTSCPITQKIPYHRNRIGKKINSLPYELNSADGSVDTMSSPHNSGLWWLVYIAIR